MVINNEKNILSIEDMTLSYGERKIFDNTSFFLHEGEKIGVIGINGTGKTTLLKIIAGVETVDSGKRTTANNLMIQMLPQTPEFDENVTVLDYVIKEASGTDSWDIEGDAKNMLNTLHVYDYDQRCSVLSGGQRKRVALAAVLLKPCDVLILDEPTNHLDHFMSEWLEGYLKNYRGSVIMVTHDRYFLDAVSSRIIEVDKGKIYSYDTNYSGFLKLKTEREEYALAAERKRQSILRNELKWVLRGAQARSTKQKARLQRFEELKNQSGPEFDGKVELSSVAGRIGNTTIELDGVTKSWEERVYVNDFTYNFLRTDRVGIVGTNGCGKTTLIRMIVAAYEKATNPKAVIPDYDIPDAGSITIGQTIKIGYYSQEIKSDKSAGIAYMDPSMRVIDYIRETAEYIETEEGKLSASNMLERFLFAGEDQYGLIGKLSGGEKRRLNLLRVLMEGPNVLILDEPTNDLDITTLAILEDYLDHFNGIVITVSHDRYFLDRIATRIFAFEEGGVIKRYEGGYTDYINRLLEEGREPLGFIASAYNTAKSKEDELSVQERKAKAREDYKASKPTKLKMTYKEQQEYDSIEDDIEFIESRIAEIEDEYVKNAHDFVKLGELAKEKESLETSLEEKMARWDYLEKLAEKIAAQS